MAETKHHPYPQNHPYIQATPKPIISNRPSVSDNHFDKPQPNSSLMNAEYLMERIHDLQQQLNTLANFISEQGKDNQSYYQQICLQNKQLRTILTEKQEKCSSLQFALQQKNEENSLLRDSLIKQNEQMEQLHHSLQEERMKVSRVTNSQVNTTQLQAKIKELNDQISNLLVKIQELVNENNDQQSNSQQLMKNLNNQNLTIEHLRQQIEHIEQFNRQLNDQNAYLKQQIRHVQQLSINHQKQMQDKYIKQLSDTQSQLQQIKTTAPKQQRQVKMGQIKSNSDREDRSLIIEKDNNNKLKKQIQTITSQLIHQQQTEKALRKNYEDRISSYQQQLNELNQEISKLNFKLRKSQAACSEYQFTIQQHQKQQERLQIYKNTYVDLEQCRNIILRLEAQKQQLTRTITKKEDLSEFHQNNQQLQIASRAHQLTLQQYQSKYTQLKRIQEQSQDQLQKNRREIRNLKQTNLKNQREYQELAKQYQIILATKQNLEIKINTNQQQLARHKQIYEDLVKKYYQTTNLYKDLEKSIRSLQGQRLHSTKLSSSSHHKHQNHHSYDKENIDLIRLQNSALNQEIDHLQTENQHLRIQIQTNRQKIQLSSLAYSQKSNYSREQPIGSQYQKMRDRQIEKLKQRQKQLYQQINKMHQKYVDQQQKNKYGAINQQKINFLQEQLSRVNKMLNQKMKQLDQAKVHEQQLSKQLNTSYQRYAQQFNVHGIKNHPQVKRLQSQIVTLQRRLMESELEFRQKIGYYEDQLKTSRVQNQHHRLKIQELMSQVVKERNNIDYNRVARKLQLSELKIKQTVGQSEYKDKIISQLTAQVKKLQSKERQNIQNRIKIQQINTLRQEHKAILQKTYKYDQSINKLVQFTNSYRQLPVYSTDPVDRVIDLVKHLDKTANRVQPNSVINYQNIYATQKQSLRNRQTNQNMGTSRYQELAREKQEIRAKFQQSQQLLKQSTSSDRSYKTEKFEKQATQLKEEKLGILDRLRRELTS